MKFKRFIAISLVGMLLLTSSGCSLNFFSTDALLKPPSLSGKSGEVQEAFNKLMSGKNVQLKTPTKGEFKSSFILADFDGDAEEEALVFYTDSSTDTAVPTAETESPYDADGLPKSLDFGGETMGVCVGNYNDAYFADLYSAEETGNRFSDAIYYIAKLIFFIMV